jgi:predicted ATP-dependent protease
MRGLTGRQGVLIPAANVLHLMLRADVVEAAEAGRFQVYAVNTVDQALELLTGIAAGIPDTKGHLPEECLNRRVAERLMQLTRLRHRHARKSAAATGSQAGKSDE